MIQPIINRSYLVEVQLASAAVNGTSPFLNVPELQYASIYGIQAFSATDMAVSPNGRPVIPDADMSGLVVTFECSGGDQDVYRYLYRDLRPGSNSGLIRLFNNKKITITKSFVTVLNVGGLLITQSMIFNFIYSLPNKKA